MVRVSVVDCTPLLESLSGVIDRLQTRLVQLLVMVTCLQTGYHGDDVTVNTIVTRVIILHYSPLGKPHLHVTYHSVVTTPR